MHSCWFVRSIVPKVALCACALLLVAGCNQGRDLEGLVEVTGQVTLDGQPISGGTVAFRPDTTKGTSGPMACGAIDENGQYRIKTAGCDGVAPGWYTVTVEAAYQVSLSGEDGKPSAIPHKYSRSDASPLKKEVKPGEKNVIDLELKSGA